MNASWARGKALALSTLVGACREPPAAATARATTSNAVLSSTPEASAVVEAAVNPSSVAVDVVVIGGDLVERATLTVRRNLTTDDVLASAHAEGVVYLTVRSGAETQVRAFATADGSKLWSQAVDSCFQPVATASGVFCEGDRGVRQLSKKEGRVRSVGREAAIVGLVRLQSRVLSLSDARTVEALNAISGAPIGTLELPEQPVSGITWERLSLAGSVVCGAAPNDESTMIMCFDGAPKLVHREEVRVPQGTLHQADEHFLVVSSWRRGTGCEVLSSGSGASLAWTSASCVGGVQTDGALDGLLALKPELRLVDPKGSNRWEGASVHHDAARIVQVGPLLVIAAYSPIATGTQLFAVDVKTGKPVWRAEVDSLPIGHSKYANRVQLQVSDDGLLLIGRESSQEFAQLFDPATGKRLASVVRAR